MPSTRCLQPLSTTGRASYYRSILGAYCKNKYGSTARQDLGGDQGWNHWSCKVGAGGVAKPQLIGIDLYDVCRNRYGKTFKPVNNTGNGYNWYCKRR